VNSESDEYFGNSDISLYKRVRYLVFHRQACTAETLSVRSIDNPMTTNRTQIAPVGIYDNRLSQGKSCVALGTPISFYAAIAEASKTFTSVAKLRNSNHFVQQKCSAL
jgi:hypothetical protein